MRLKLLLSFAISLIFGTATAQIENPVSWSSHSTGTSVTFTATIDTPWHIYDLGPYVGGPNATSFTFELPEGVLLDGEITPERASVVKMDDIFGMRIGTYGGSISFTQRFLNTTGSAQTIDASVEWQSCDDGSCLPPMDEYFTVEISADAADATAGVDPSGDMIGDDAMMVAPEQGAIEGEVTSGGSGSLWATIIEAILWGFAALLTPCVFPMVPMTVSFFMKSNDSKSRGRMMAGLYGISIVALYTIPIAVIILSTFIFGGEAVTADIFNWLATHWVPNILFFLIFMIFAASFFGAFEISMPTKLVNKTDAKSDKGGLIGVFFMAATLVLVSFSCTGPIVGTILVKSTQGEIWEPIITMIAFSAAFALPFTIFAFFPSLLKNLPKSGGWLNSVKVVLGFIELALGLKFLSVADQTYHWGILDREVYLALWIVIFTLLGFYLLGKLRFAHDSQTKHVSVKSLFMSIITFAFVVYLIPGMWGAPLKALSGYLPPLSTMDFNVAAGGGSSSSSVSYLDLSKIEGGKPKHSEFLHLPYGLEGFFDFEQGIEYAKAVGKPVFLDFTGHGCVNCREMEANVWSDPAVVNILRENYVVIAIYVDDRTELAQEDWVVTANGRTQKTIGKVNAAWQIERFGINAQPYYCLINPDTDELLVTPRAYDLSVSGFVAFLEQGIEAFKAQH
ncbi:MAG: cytochrome c biogenesis protein CcdA [Rikenellaceae bacterium]